MKMFFYLPLLYSLIYISSVHAGVVIGGTRFIYDEGKPSISFRVRNEDSFNYLVVTKIYADDGKATSGSIISHSEDKNLQFVADPPLFLLKHHKEGIIRLMKTTDNFPHDRESLAWVSIASIPAMQNSATGNTLQIAVRAHMKLIYRPKGLIGDPGNAYSQLTWARLGSQVSVTNPTPWYVTLVRLQSNGKTITEPGMVAPFSTRKQPWCPSEGTCQLQWQTLNDYGALLPPLHTNL